jgi:glutaredoxin
MSPTERQQTNKPRLPQGWQGLVLALLVFWGGSQGWTWWRDTRLATQLQQLARLGSITLYTSMTCVYCARAHDWLDANKVPWSECPIESDSTCMATYNAQGAPGTPLVRVNKLWQLGFDPSQIAQALQANANNQSSKPNAAASPRP